MINIRIALAFILIMTGCKRSSSGRNRNKLSKKASHYILKVDGVECALCAKKTILALEKISGVLRAEYICNDSHYYDCFVKIYLVDKDAIISQQIVNDQLVHEGFELVSMTRV